MRLCDTRTRLEWVYNRWSKDYSGRRRLLHLLTLITSADLTLITSDVAFTWLVAKSITISLTGFERVLLLRKGNGREGKGKGKKMKKGGREGRKEGRGKEGKGKVASWLLGDGRPWLKWYNAEWYITQNTPSRAIFGACWSRQNVPQQPRFDTPLPTSHLILCYIAHCTVFIDYFRQNR